MYINYVILHQLWKLEFIFTPFFGYDNKKSESVESILNNVLIDFFVLK